MEILNKLRPAEAYFLMNWLASDEKLLNFTLGGLLMGKYLEIKFIKKMPHPKAKRSSTYKMVRRGENFNNLDIRFYEKEILEVMGSDEKREVQLRLFAKAVGSKFWKNETTFRDDYMGQCPNMIDYFQNHFLLKYFDRRTLKGKKLGKQLKQFFETKDNELKLFQNANDDKNILLLIEELGLHVIILKNFNNDIMRELRKKYSNSNNDYFNDFIFLDSGFSDFANSFDSFEGFGGGDFGGAGGGGSWSDGDSGCSSCSGCGGCGGCS